MGVQEDKMDKWMFKQPEAAKLASIKYIKDYFPELLGDIEDYAKANNADVGDIAAITINDIIIPTLEERCYGKKCPLLRVLAGLKEKVRGKLN